MYSSLFICKNFKNTEPKSAIDLTIECYPTRPSDEKSFVNDLKIIKRLFFASFRAAYKTLTPESLGLVAGQTIEQRLAEVYQDDYEKLCENKLGYVIARINGQAVASATFRVDEKFKNVYLSVIAVAPGYQKRGLGNELIAAIQRRCHEHKGVELDTRAANKNAVFFYEKLGFLKKKPGESNAEYTGQESVIGFEKSNQRTLSY